MFDLSGIKRFGKKIDGAIDKGLRFGERAAGAAKKFGDRVTHVASEAHKITGAASSMLAGVPVLGTAAGLADKAAMGAMAAGKGISGAAGTAQSAIGAGQNIVRTGKSMMEARGGGDIKASMRDIQREAGNIKSAGMDLRSQVKSMGTKLQRG